MKDKRYTGSPDSHLQFSACAAPVTSGWALLKQLDPPPARLQPCLMFCQANSEMFSFQLLIKGGSFIPPYMVID